MDNVAEEVNDGYVNGYGEGETKRVDVGVSEEESSSVMVSDEKLTEDLEGEEVFQEAMEPQEQHFNDQGGGGAVVAGEEGNDDAATFSAPPLPLVEETPSAAAQDSDNFEEAIGVADKSAKHTEEEVEVITNHEVDKVGDHENSSAVGELKKIQEQENNNAEEKETSQDTREQNSENSSVVGELEKIQEQENNNAVEKETSQDTGEQNSENSSVVEELENIPEQENNNAEEKETSQDTREQNSEKTSVVGELEKIQELENRAKEKEISQVTIEQNSENTSVVGELEKIQEPENNGKEKETSQVTREQNGENLSVVGELEKIQEQESNEKEEETSQVTRRHNSEDSSMAEELEKIQEPENNAKKKETSQVTRELNGENSSVVGELENIQEQENNTKEKETSHVTRELNSENSSVVGELEKIHKQQNNAKEKETSQVTRELNSENSSVVGELDKIHKQQNNAKEKEASQVTREPNSEPSSSGKPVATGTPPLRPAGLGRAAPLFEPAPRPVPPQPHANGTVSNTQSRQMEDSSSVEPEEYDETREKLQMIRVKFLRLAHRLGQTPHNVVVAQVLYRLGLAEQLRGRNGGRVGAFSFDRASAMAEQLEAAGQEPLDFSCTIMVLGKTGVGKTATINSIFDEIKFHTDAFHMGTKKVQDVVGTVQGIKVRVIDTPGLLPSWSDQRHNEKTLHSVKRFIKNTPPDIVLYLDRLDMQSRDFSDMPLLRTITEIFGPSIWFNAIVVLTHAASAPPDGPNGTPSSYDMFVTQRSHVVQQAIRQAAGDMRLMNPVSLVENHSACRINRAGQRVLPNGQVWKPHLLLLSFASKILGEANALLKLQDSPPGKPYTARARAPPLPFLLSSLLQSRPQLKLPEEQFGDEDSLDDDLDESSDSDDETDPDDLPPFKRLTKAQVEKLSRAQKKAYFDELEYREKLFMKKQLKEEKKQRKMMKKMAESAKDLPSDYSENVEEESGGAASVPVPMPDLSLPASFDSDNPTHRYRYLDSSNQWLVRPVLETHGWDHDVGYEGLNVERLFVLKEKIPVSFSGQVTKDKKDANVQMEMATSVKYGEGKATSLGFDMQTVGKDLAYTIRSETKFSNFWRNTATAGLSFTLLGDALSAGVKVEDKLVANKRFKVVFAGGAMAGRGDVAYGGSLEAQLRDKDYPLGRSLSTLGLSIMDWHGDLAVGCNVQSQIPVGRHTNLVARANLNNRGAGQISIRLNSAEQLQIALIGLIPLLKKLVGYHQQLQYEQ